MVFEYIMHSQILKVRFSGEPAKKDRFLVKLAEMEIPFKADRTSETFTISMKDYVMTEALASVLLITLSAMDEPALSMNV